MGKRNTNGEGTIYQRKKDGRWFCEITIGWDARGRRKVLRHGAKTRREVAEWRAKQLADRQRGLLVEPSRETVGSDRWLAETVAHEVKPGTLRNYRDIVRAYIVPTLAVRQTLVKIGGSMRFGTPKTQASNRTILAIRQAGGRKIGFRARLLTRY